MSWVDFEDFDRAREWINEPQPHQIESGSFYDDEGPDPEPFDPRENIQGELATRLNSLKPGLPCCGEGGACTGGASCWHDEPDNIREDWE